MLRLYIFFGANAAYCQHLKMLVRTLNVSVSVMPNKKYNKDNKRLLIANAVLNDLLFCKGNKHN